MIICEQCAAEIPDGFRFCGGCGAPLGETPPARESRKVVTALFCDVTGSTALGEELDPEVLRGVLNRYFAELRAIIERHGGTVEKFIGDAVMAVFGVPRVHEDDALRAVRAAAEIRDRLPGIAEQTGLALRFRTGVNTGQVLMGEGENLAIGDAVNVAARLEQAARPGEIVLGSETLRLVRGAVEVEALEPLFLKGKSEPVPAYRLISVDPAAEGLERRFDVEFVGRERELRILGEAWDRVVGEGGCHLFTLLGSAGVGKSRLVGELLSGIGGSVTVLRGRCLHYGEGITFWPLIQALTEAGEAGQEVVELLTSGGTATPEELFWAVRRLLESLAVGRPVVLYIDDLQWAEPLLLDLLDHVVDLSRGVPILVLCTARPELLEERPGWGGGKLNATTVLLEPLGRRDCEQLLDRLGDALEPGARERALTASEGNPLFLEQMVALAAERGTAEVPSSIQALLSARLERLAPAEREVLERGAIEGEVFHRLPLKALSGQQTGQVEPGLTALVRKELIRPHAAVFADDDAFRFRHLLIRDAAYDGLPKAIRAELHGLFATWVIGNAPDLAEFDEIAGWHLEQCVRYRRELGQPVEEDLTQAAAKHLREAGRRAAARSDAAAAQKLLQRALALAGETSPLYAEIATDLAEQLLHAGEFGRADELLTVLERRSSFDPATLIRLEWLIWMRPEEAVQRIEATLPGLIAQFTTAGDERNLARAHLVGFYAMVLLSNATAAAERARLVIVHARTAGDEGLRARAIRLYVQTLILGPANVDTLRAEIDAIEQEESGPYLNACVTVGRGWVARLEGRLDEARTLMSQAIDQYAALGRGTRPVDGSSLLADIELTAGNPDAAVTTLKRFDVIFAAEGERSRRSTVQAMLSVAHQLAGDPVAAQAAIRLSDQLTSPHDVINYATTHRIRARMALADGDPEAAETWARSAVDNACLTDYTRFEAMARLDLARVLGARGRLDEAAEEASRALALSDARGDRPGLDEAEAVLRQLRD